MTTNSTRYRDTLNALEQTLQTMKKFENEGYADDYFAAFHFLDTYGDAIRESLTIAEATQQEPSEAVIKASLPAFWEVNDILQIHFTRTGEDGLEWKDGKPPLYHAFKAMVAQLLKEVKEDQ